MTVVALNSSHLEGIFALTEVLQSLQIRRHNTTIDCLMIAVALGVRLAASIWQLGSVLTDVCISIVIDTLMLAIPGMPTLAWLAYTMKMIHIVEAVICLLLAGGLVAYILKNDTERLDATVSTNKEILL